MTLIAALAAFAAGWFVHRRRVYWATIHVRGELEQWIEHEIQQRLDLYASEGRRSTLLGSGSLETLDSIVGETLDAHWPRHPVRRLWVTLFYRPKAVLTLSERRVTPASGTPLPEGRE